MRALVIVALTLAVLVPGRIAAQGNPTSVRSVARVSHAVLKPGQSETLLVDVVDLAGRPLAGARALATVSYGSFARWFALPRTNRHGHSTATFRPPAAFKKGKATVRVDVTNGYLHISLATSFSVETTGAGPGHNATPTPIPARAGKLKVVAAVVPPAVTAPAPEWVVVYAEAQPGKGLSGAAVDVTVHFLEGVVHATGTTDSAGVASLQIDTSRVRVTQVVRVNAKVQKGTQSGSGTAQFSAAAPYLPAPTATATPTDVVVNDPPPTSVPTAVPTATSDPTAVPGGIVILPAPTSAATVTPMPTNTPASVAINTPISQPTETSTPAPSPTSVPPSPTPTQTTAPLPTATATPLPNCPGSQSGCMQAMLNILNGARAQYNLPALGLNSTQSFGTSTCAGSYGHSVAMAQSGTIWHQNASYPSASFPNNICVGTFTAGENVGQMSSGDELRDLQGIQALMMSEPYTPGCVGSHICNILSTQYHSVGIGIYQYNGATWLTEDFLG